MSFTILPGVKNVDAKESIHQNPGWKPIHRSNHEQCQLSPNVQHAVAGQGRNYEDHKVQSLSLKQALNEGEVLSSQQAEGPISQTHKNRFTETSCRHESY